MTQPDQDQSGFSRICPACARRVPRNVATCRCGAALPVKPSEEEEPASGGSTATIAIVVAVLVIGGAGYWYFTGSGPAAARARAASSEEEALEVSSTAPAGASPEARAWDAAAARAAEPLKNADSPAAPAAPANPSAPAPLPAALEDMVDRVMPAVVLIETTSGRGSGFFVRHDTLITNVHVVQNDGYVTLRRMDGSTLNARVESRAPALDIAVLKVATPSPSQVVVPMGSAHSLKPGQEIIVIGSALGTLQNSVSRGIVSGLRSSGGATLVQTDAATNPGNSGGPMLDRSGAVIGITTMGYRNAEGLNFGVAIDHARDLLEGRQANLGNQTGLTDIQSQSRGSESDRRQQQAEEQLRQQIAQMAEAAERIDAGWKRFRDQCYKSPIPGSYDRGWFALLVPRALPADASAGCSNFFAGMDGDVRQFRGLMQHIVSDARRANVLPGTVRDQLRSNRLDFDWER